MIIFYVALIASILGNFIMWKFFPMVAPGYTVWTIFVCFVTYMALTRVWFQGGLRMVEQNKKKKLNKAPSVKIDKDEVKKSIHIFNKMVKNITFPRWLNHLPSKLYDRMRIRTGQ